MSGGIILHLLIWVDARPASCRRKRSRGLSARRACCQTLHPPGARRGVGILGRLSARDWPESCGVHRRLVPQQRLYFVPEPHGHGSLRPTLPETSRVSIAESSVARSVASLRRTRMARGMKAAASICHRLERGIIEVEEADEWRDQDLGARVPEQSALGVGYQRPRRGEAARPAPDRRMHRPGVARPE